MFIMISSQILLNTYDMNTPVQWCLDKYRLSTDEKPINAFSLDSKLQYKFQIYNAYT